MAVKEQVPKMGVFGEYYDLVVTFFLSLTAWPILFIFDNWFMYVHKDIRTMVMMWVGFGILAAIIYVVSKISRLKSWTGYVFMLFSFTCMIDLIIALEYRGIIGGFMSQYLKMGEPYLHSPWGAAISLFDGLGFYAMYLGMVHQISNGKSWRSLGIYWASGIINSMVVLLIGVAAGRHPPTWCVLMNIPYAVFPVVVIWRLFTKEHPPGWRTDGSSMGSITEAIFHLGMVLAYFFITWITFAKGMVCFGSTFNSFTYNLKHEPSLLDLDPAPFAKIQSIVLLLYSVPILIISALYVARKKRPQFLWDLALINAGMLAQAQFSRILTALDPGTKEEFRTKLTDVKFWNDNLTLLIVPHVFVWMLYRRHIAIVRGKGKKVH